jgi:cytochrome b subunit of formate dehydrogenase
MPEERLDGPNKTVHNEIQKLRANFLNGCGIAAGATGVIIPFLQQLHSQDNWQWIPFAVYGSIGIAIALLCHSLARIYIFKIRE